MKTEIVKIYCKGKTFEIISPKGDYITKIMKKTHKFYEQDFLFHLLEKYKNFVGNKKILDVGAFIGTHSIFFSHFFNVEVLAFEPNQYTLMLNNIKNFNVQFYFTSLLDKKRFILCDYIDDKNQGTFRIKKFLKKETNDSLVSQPLDDFTDLTTKIGLIKIDVEGLEFKVLQGAKETIKRYNPIIVLESWDIVETMNTCGKFLFELGYKLEPIFKSKEKQINLEFTPESFHG